MKKKVLISVLFAILLCTVLMLTGCKEAPAVTIADVEKTHSSISFDLSIADPDGICVIQKIELTREGADTIELTDLNAREFTNLLSDTKYKIDVTYFYDLGLFAGEKTVVASTTVRTRAKAVPTVKLSDLTENKKSIGFDFNLEDPDSTCTVTKAELYLGETKINELTSFTNKVFDGLLSGKEYTVKLHYTYDLNDGTGVKSGVVEKKGTTKKLTAPKVDISDVAAGVKDIAFGLDKTDSDNTIISIKAELYLDGTKVSEITSFENAKFDGLLSNTKYTVKIVYSYDLNDGEGAHNGEISEDITSKEIPTPVILLTTAKHGSTGVTYSADVVTSFTTYKFIKAEVIYDGDVVVTYTNEEAKTFNNLVEGRKYTLKLYYSYDTNSSEGDREISHEKTFLTGNYSSKIDVINDWQEDTLLVAATAWAGVAGYPWATVEIVVKEGCASGFGEKIDAAVLERTAYIKNTYGVDVIWEYSSRYHTHSVIQDAILAGNDPDYDLAMPRKFRAQALVINNSVYDLAGREYLDFDNSYFNKNSVETYTAKGHTFFITGDFSNLDKETAFILYFNKNMLTGGTDADDIYQMVRDGEWTWDQLVSLANSHYRDDGDGRFGDTDTYGLSISSVDIFYEYFGVKQVGVDKDTGEWILTLNDPKVNDIVSVILAANTANWTRSAWGGGLGTNAQQALADGRLLFYNDILNYVSIVAPFGDIGIVPFPMLNESQGRYYVPCASQQPTLMCVPKTTSDRNMSDYFIDVLAWTGNEYVMEAYYETMATYVDSDVEMEIIKEYIVPNISYDAGNSTYNFGSVLGGAIAESYSGNINNFEQAYNNAEATALEIIKEWNDSWGTYTE